MVVMRAGSRGAAQLWISIAATMFLERLVGMSVPVLQLLEFPELLALVAGYAQSPLGGGAVAALLPGDPPEVVHRRLGLAGEAMGYLRPQQGKQTASASSESGSESGSPPPVSFAGLVEPSAILAKLAVEGSVLEISEILALLHLCRSATEIRQSIGPLRRRFPELSEVAGRLAGFQPLNKRWAGKILPSGDLDDGASPQLRRIRREIERQRSHIHSSLRSLLRQVSDEPSQQEEIITIRGDRYVIPVRAQKKSQMKGVVHGASSRGHTVYVEPLETIEMNNDLVRLREEEIREIHRILLEMTASLRERAGELGVARECLATLDCAFASARFAREYDCVIPSFHPEPDLHPDEATRLELVDARHPLLEHLLRRRGESVVPLSLALEQDGRMVVISGPNTGGKTVAMKTAGLLALMAVSGLPVPAAKAELPFVDRVLADIGDSQSIEESLSTFSAHLLNIASILNEATGSSLVLLDELGSATDPEEAGALAVAVADRLREIGCFTICSTHHMALKAFATNTPGLVSANMGFDEEQLEPTYRLQMGLPGSSSGLATAERLGLPATVIERARRALSASHHDVQQFILRLRDESERAAALGQHLAQRLAAQEKREAEWAATESRRETERREAWERQLETLSRNLAERAEQKLRELGAQGPRSSGAQQAKKKAAQWAARFQEQASREMRQTLQSHSGRGDGAVPSPVPAEAVYLSRKIEVGDHVKLKSLGRAGVVRSKTPDSLEVEIGFLRTRVPYEDVEEIVAPSPRAPASKQTGIQVQMEEAGERALTEINVIGETAEDARRRVDKFLDDACLAQLSRVRIVHGSGKGILRNSLAGMFTGHPQVERFSLAKQEEGGGGVTIVELKT